MRTLLGIIMIIVGIILGLFVGLWVCFIGGIIDIAEVINSMMNVKDYSVEVMKIAWAVIKICFAGLAGWASALFLIIPGVAMVND